MKKLHQKIWDLALPYQDKREDPGHAATVLKYAQKLLTLVPKANPDVVIPAAILHDIGWSRLPKGERMKIFTSPEWVRDSEKNRVRRWHEREGARLAQSILMKCNYPKEFRSEIIKIVSGHDSRKGSFSINDAVMRDADKLWRYSKKGVSAAIRRRRGDGTDEIKYMHWGLRSLFFTHPAKAMSRQELVARTKEIPQKRVQ